MNPLPPSLPRHHHHHHALSSVVGPRLTFRLPPVRVDVPVPLLCSQRRRCVVCGVWGWLGREGLATWKEAGPFHHQAMQRCRTCYPGTQHAPKPAARMPPRLRLAGHGNATPVAVWLVCLWLARAPRVIELSLKERRKERRRAAGGKQEGGGGLSEGTNAICAPAPAPLTPQP